MLLADIPLKAILSHDLAGEGETAIADDQATIEEVCYAMSGTSQRQYGLRDTRFKLVNNLGKWELYDLAADPHEERNLAKDPASAKLLAAMREKLAALREAAK